MHYTKSDLEKSADTILRDKCQVIYGKANANIVVFDFIPENAEQFKTLHKTIKLTKKTAKMGSFYCKSLPAGKYSVTVSKKGFTTQTHTVNVTDGETIKLNVEMIKE